MSDFRIQPKWSKLDTTSDELRTAAGFFTEVVWTEHMAIIKLDPDNLHAGIWWMKWGEREEIIGRIIRDSSGRCQIAPLGPQWSPMKSFGGLSFDTCEGALAEVQLYFRDR